MKKTRIATPLIVVLIALMVGVSSSAPTLSLSISSEGTITYSLQYDLPWIHTEGKNFVDEYGNIVYLHGCNYEGLEWSGFQRGISKSHIEQIKSWGFNIIRLPFTWEHLEPTRGSYDDEGYWSYVDQVVQWCEEVGIYVFLDFHQWHWCRKYGSGYAGLPYWAAWPATAEESRQTFINNVRGPDGTWPQGLLDYFYDMWRHVVSKYIDNPVVIGYEIMNEPDFWSSSQLNIFYTGAADAIRAEEGHTKHIIFFEGGGGYADCQGGIANYPNVAFANHGYFMWQGPYTGPAQTDGYGFTLETYTLSHMVGARNIPALHGEYAYSASWSGAGLYTRDIHDILDLYGMSGTWWQCPIPNTGTGGMALVKTIDGVPRTPDPTFFDNGVDRPFVRKTSIAPSTTSYTYSGTSWDRKAFKSFDLTTKEFQFVTTQGSGTHQMEIYVPQRFYPNGFRLTINASVSYNWDANYRILEISFNLQSSSALITMVPHNTIEVIGG